MKTKPFSKKLALNKHTVAHLGQAMMNGVKGGTIPTTGKDVTEGETCGPLCEPTWVDTCPSNCPC